jgi:alginate O-acetyltransferase complex protein AlgI
MSLTSPAYLIFLGLLFVVWWASARLRGAAPLVVLGIAANCLFWWRWSWIYLMVIPACAGIDFLLARWIAASDSAGRRQIFLALSVLLNLSLIVSSKLTGSQMSWLLPLSLSFYGFQAMTYTIDVYRQDAKPVPSFATHFASVAFFPTVLAGPITRVGNLAPQWAKIKPLTDSDGSRALFLIALGVSKKYLIADYLGEHLVNRVFDTPGLYSAAETLLGVYGYAFQLYYDFSGYTDIALGSALLLGLKLPANFNRPYESTSVAEFWRRWHISFSSWLRDYLYFSLPGKRGRVAPYLNLVVTMIAGGLWHGFAWTFVIWGGLHGAGLAAAHGWQALRGRRAGSPVGRFLARVATYHFVVLGWVFFRASNVGDAVDVLGRIVSLDAGASNVSAGFVVVLVAAAFFHFLPAGFYRGALSRFEAAPAFVQALVLALVAASIQYVNATGSAPFVYQRF